MEQPLHEVIDTAPLVVSLGGDTSVDAELLVRTIHNFVDLVEYAKQDISPESDIRLSVKAFRPGSFVIDFEAIVKLLTSDGFANFVTSTGAIVTVLVGLFKLAKHLIGQKPKNIEQDKTGQTINVENAQGQIININAKTFNLYSKPASNEKVAQIFNDLEEDKSRTNLTVSAKDETVSFDSSEFSTYSKPTSLVDVNTQVLCDRFEANVLIKKPDLLGNSKWEVYFNKVIRVTMEDDNYLNKVHNREETFSGGDSLRVRLRIETEFDNNGALIEGSERYFIEEVLGSVEIPRTISERQISMFDDETNMNL
jgi:hypothetical protein